MAYTYSLHWHGADGTKSQEGGSEYDAVWRVITDNPLDQVQKVVARFEIDKVKLGDTYSYANDSDPNAVAKSIKPVREKGTTDTWVVTVHYAPREAGESSFELITEDLPLRCEDVSMQTIQHQRPVERARYRGGFVGKAALKVADGDIVLPMNSAFVPFNPGLEMDVAGLSVRIVRRLKSVDGTAVKSLMNSVNSEPFTIFHCGFVLDVLSYQARVVAGALALRVEDGSKYWELPLFMEIIEEGWREEVVDRGVAARAIVDDADGRGGSLSQNDMIAGVPRHRELVDVDETPIADPVLFDGDGKPLDISVAGKVVPVYLTYQKYMKEIPFNTITYFNGFIV